MPDSKLGSDEAVTTGGGCDRSSAALPAHRRVGPALDQVVEEPLAKQEKACAYSTCTDSGFRDSW